MKSKLYDEEKNKSGQKKKKQRKRRKSASMHALSRPANLAIFCSFLIRPLNATEKR